MGKQTRARDRRSTEFGSGSDFVRCPDTTQICLFGSMREKKDLLLPYLYILSAVRCLIVH